MENQITPPKVWDIKDVDDFNQLPDEEKVIFVNNVIQQKNAVAHQQTVLLQKIARNERVVLIPSLLLKISKFLLNLLIIYVIIRFAPELFRALRAWVSTETGHS